MRTTCGHWQGPGLREPRRPLSVAKEAGKALLAELIGLAAVEDVERAGVQPVLLFEQRTHLVGADGLSAAGEAREECIGRLLILRRRAAAAMVV